MYVGIRTVSNKIFSRTSWVADIATLRFRYALGSDVPINGNLNFDHWKVIELQFIEQLVAVRSLESV